MKINRNNITHIKTYIKCKNPFYYYLNEKKCLGFVTRLAGFRNMFSIYDSTICSEEEILKNNFIKNNTVYYKPHIDLYCDKTRIETIYFETESMLEDYVKKEFSGIKWLET